MGDGQDLGDGWSLALTGVRHDATEEIAAANMFNDPPEPGRQFVLVDLIVAYNGLEDPRSPFDVSFDAVGQGSVGYDSFGCGVLPNDLDSSRDVFSGGSLSGQICFDVDSGDADSLVLYASAGFFGKDIFFSLFEESESPTGVSTRLGPVAGAASSSNRSDPIPTGTSAPIGGGWTLAVNGSSPDGTAEVLAENQFNDPPPDGHIFFLAEVVLTNDGQEKQDAFFVEIEAVGNGNAAYDLFGCGVIPNELDIWVELFPGGSVSGEVCFVVPESEAGSDVLVYANGELFGDESVFFATTSAEDGSGPAPTTTNSPSSFGQPISRDTEIAVRGCIDTLLDAVSDHLFIGVYGDFEQAEAPCDEAKILLDVDQQGVIGETPLNILALEFAMFGFDAGLVKMVQAFGGQMLPGEAPERFQGGLPALWLIEEEFDQLLNAIPQS